MDETSPRPSLAPPPSGSTWHHTLEIGTLFSFAVAQPIYDLLSRGADFLVAHRLQSTDLIALVGLISLLSPSLLALLAWLQRQVYRKHLLHSLWVTLLSAALVLQVLKELSATLALALAVGLGLLFAQTLMRRPGWRRFIAVLSPAILIFPALFLLRPSVFQLLFPQPVVIEGAVAAETPVILIVWDELPVSSLMDRERLIDATRYPAFADVAKDSHWFRNASTVAESTTYAVPAILTGRYPDQQRVGVLQSYPENLFTWLGASYKMNVFETLTRLCPDDLRQTTELEESFGERMRSTLRDIAVLYAHLLLPTQWATDLPQVSSTWRDFAEPPPATEAVSSSAANRAADEASEFGGSEKSSSEPRKDRGAIDRIVARFSESIQPTRYPVLHFFHVNLPHLPWKYLPSGKEYGPLGAKLRPHGLNGEQWHGDEWATVLGFQRHLLQVGYTDRVLGQLLDRLRQAKLYERSLVIVTADHGVSFWPGHSRRGVSEKTQADILNVPLFIKTPFQNRGVIDDRNVETIDILPTIADVLGAPLPWPVDGRSALDDSQPPRREKVLIDTAGGQYVGQIVLEDRIRGIEHTLERMHSLFGSRAGSEGLFRIGRFHQLVGRKASELPVGPGRGQRVLLEDAESFESFDPEASYVPARIVGSITPPADPAEAQALAVAVNGTLRAMAETYESARGELKFTAMVPEDSFRRGTNQIDVFEISADRGAPYLRPIENLPTVRHVLEFGSDGSAKQIAVSDGRSYRIAPDALQGEVFFNGVEFKGWAAEIETARVAEAVLLFRGGDLIARARTGEFRRDLFERSQERALALAGFSFVVPYSVMDDPMSSEIRFFAVIDDIATALALPDS